MNSTMMLSGSVSLLTTIIIVAIVLLAIYPQEYCDMTVGEKDAS